ncbi:unnamed protein product [Psylliodes chrysocephalus]|uniref:Uncharacterized protein n=1 Tax=Psylliodes chrysocephalus TaxID=3402493 RepID=A0A9P0CW55_9CUCU|nr:unnamed protein product [Psylliodes chrysocephala]
MSARGVSQQDIIVICSKNNADQVIGAICAPLDPEYTYAEKQHLLKKLKPKMCFGDIRTSAHLERILYTLNLNTEVFSFTQEGLDKERTIESMDKGYFKTGDMGKFDEDGWLYVSGRIEDLIQYDTWSLIPTDIEDCISSHEKVKDAVVIGNNKDVVAMVQKVPESPLTAKEIQIYICGRLPEKYWPTEIILLEHFPRTTIGAVKKSVLKEDYLFHKLTYSSSCMMVKQEEENKLGDSKSSFHHTLLHKPKENEPATETSEETVELVVEEASQVNTFSFEDIEVYVILSTALVQVIDEKDETNLCRALLDTGDSKSSFHHTLLHKPKENEPATETSEETVELVVEEASQVNTFSFEDIEVYVILSTALVQVIDEKDETNLCRALLDTGDSKSSFHHTLLHKPKENEPATETSEETVELVVEEASQVNTFSFKDIEVYVILSTALVQVIDEKDETNLCRALLDTGDSKSSFHHTLLHKPKENEPATETSEETVELVVEEASQVNTFSFEDIEVYVILSTALVQVIDEKDETNLCRALLDTGDSKSSFHHTLLHKPKENEPAAETSKEIAELIVEEASQVNTFSFEDIEVYVILSTALVQENEPAAETSEKIAELVVEEASQVNTFSFEDIEVYVILSIALIQVIDEKDETNVCRALLDTGAQSNLIAKDFWDSKSSFHHTLLHKPKENEPAAETSEKIAELVVEEASQVNTFSFKDIEVYVILSTALIQVIDEKDETN